MDNYSRKRVLVLGGSGLLGIHCFYELKNDYDVMLTYQSTVLPVENSTYFNALDGRESLDKLLDKYRPDIIINTIALISLDGCQQAPLLAEQLNVKFVTDIVNSMSGTGLQDCSLIQISSDSIYGNDIDEKNHPWSEYDSNNPLSIYAKTKLQGEAEARLHVGPSVILRTAFYGTNPYSSKSLLRWIIDNAENGREMDGWDNVFFNPVSATRLVDVIKLMINKSIVGTYNVGSVDACSKFDFVDAVCDAIGKRAKINRVKNIQSETHIIRPTYSVLSTKKLSQVMPWSLCWRDDLKWYLKHRFPCPEGVK